MTNLLAKLWRRLNFSKQIQLNIMNLTQDKFLIGTTGIVFNNQDEILLFKHTYRQIQWSLPGGYMKAREHPTESLEREIKEESGLIVSIDKEIGVRADRESARLDISFIGTYIGGDFKKSREVSEFQFFPFENLPILFESQLFMIKQALLTKNPKLHIPEPKRL